MFYFPPEACTAAARSRNCVRALFNLEVRCTLATELSLCSALFLSSMRAMNEMMNKIEQLNYFKTSLE